MHPTHTKRNPTRTTDMVETLIETMAAYMRLKLLENSHKPHWLDELPQTLTEGIFQESQEFWAALYAYNSAPSRNGLEEIRREAADVANSMAMLIARLAENHRPKQED